MVAVKNKVCLIVHDGWGLASTTGEEGNAIAAANTPRMDAFSSPPSPNASASSHSARSLAAHGTSVGLSPSLMGNSEVGHLNIGAGRVVWQDIVRIDMEIRKKLFHTNKTITESLTSSPASRIHLLGLISDGGVHSHIKHVYALLETAVTQKVAEVYIHFFGDGRDTAPKSGAGYLKDLLAFIDKLDKGNTTIKLATIVGRYYAMDRDKRWERIKIAADALLGTSTETETVGTAEEAIAAIEKNYENGVTDEFLKPIVVGGDEGRVKENDSLFFFNYRSDRMRELSSTFGKLDDVDNSVGVKIPDGLKITTMSRYNASYPFSVAYPPQAMTNVLAETLGAAGVRQAHIAETEKYAHVTFFFNGGQEASFPGEERHMIPSPKVATYDLKPEMSVKEVAERVVQVLQGEDGKEAPEFVMCNFAPPDMVGHTGSLAAATIAIGATDEAVGIVYDACMKNNYILLVTADHGNAEKMLATKKVDGKLVALEGKNFTAHTCSRVPFLLAVPPVSVSASGETEKLSLLAEEKTEEVTEPKTEAAEVTKAEEADEEAVEADDDGANGALCDVAPTILDIMGIEKPEEMGGRSLLVRG